MTCRYLALFACLTVAGIRAPAQDSWLEVATPYPQGLSFGTATDTVRNCVVAVRLTRTIEWHGTRWIERDTATDAPSRQGIGLTFHASRGETVMFGGSDATGFPVDTWTYDGDTWVARTTTTQPPGRRDLQLSYDPLRDRTVMFGGFDGSYRSDTWEWDGTTWQQMLPSTTPPGRQRFGMAWDPVTQRTLVFGGESASGRLDDTWAWDGTDWTLLAPTTSPPPEEEFLMVTDPLRDIIVVYLRGPGGFFDLQTWTWNGSDWSQAATTDGPNSPRHSVAAFDPSSGGVIAAFGLIGSSLGPMDTQLFDGSDWGVIHTFPNTVVGELETDDARGVVVMFSSMSRDRFATWEWDGRSWSAGRSTNAPPARLNGAVLSADTPRGVNVLFGGLAPSGPSDDTWEWDGTDWTLRNPSNRPSARLPVAMQYDPVRDRSVMFGGNDASGAVQDTWLWDGTDWTEVFPATTPPAFGVGEMVWDAARQVVVLVGSNVPMPDETWEWDGTDWTHVNTINHPSVSSSSTQSLVYDRNRNLVVLRSGDDIWTYDGIDWTFEQTIAAQRFNGMAWDPVHGRILGVEQTDGDVWVYAPPIPATATRFGAGCVGTAGVPKLAPRGLPSVMRPDFVLETLHAAANAPLVLQLGVGSSSIPFGACTLLAATATSFSIPLGATNGGGYAQVVMTVPTNTTLLGTDFAAQALVLDVLGGGLGLVAMTNGVLLTPGY